jgi:RNA polymerase sigma-70 factor (sigma-E family)
MSTFPGPDALNRCMPNHEPPFEDHFPALAAIAYRVGFRLLGDRGEAEEVAQEALARAYARWPSVADHAEPWVARVASNLAIGRWRRRRPTVLFVGSHAGARPSNDEHSLERLGLADALRRLPRRQREVLVLRYLADLPERDVATAMHTSVGTVKRHAHRALASLRRDLLMSPIPAEADDA